jgi:type III secretion system low calcium response chaperone LcrH/SycD
MAETSEAGGPRAGLILEGGTWKDVVGLDEQDMRAIYSLGYVQYDQGKFDEADKTFRVLCFHDHKNPSYWLGLGAARQQLHDFEGAIAAYSMVDEVGGTDPRAPLYAAECYMALGLYEEAISGLEVAHEWAGHAAEPDKIHRHIEVLFTALEQMLGKAAGAPAGTRPSAVTATQNQDAG